MSPRARRHCASRPATARSTAAASASGDGRVGPLPAAAAAVIAGTANWGRRSSGTAIPTYRVHGSPGLGRISAASPRTTAPGEPSGANTALSVSAACNAAEIEPSSSAASSGSSSDSRSG